ncbi:alkaline ceramidase 1 [Tiliqua scincoides]|uniref:alkaline ceramidase 1 n=1 Tax=Tiliqua scincoides TaxID=71010 RepID=UPI0034634EC2
MPSIFGYLSAEVDWCEENFKHSEYITEYYNTISNVGFFIVPPLMMWLNTQYNNHRPVALRSLAIMEMFIGIFSLYFHMTLSYAGQLLDELSILWTVGVSYALWMPVRHFPRFIKTRDQFIWTTAIVTVLSTIMSFVKPTLNAYVLNCIAIHLFYLTAQNLKKCNNPRVHRVALSMTVWWMIAIACWITDKVLCGFCQRINFCYLHSFWHICISIAIFYCATMIIYFDVLYDLPSSNPEVMYWPSNTSPIALPYLVFQDSQKLC